MLNMSEEGWATGKMAKSLKHVKYEQGQTREDRQATRRTTKSLKHVKHERGQMGNQEDDKEPQTH